MNEVELIEKVAEELQCDLPTAAYIGGAMAKCAEAGMNKEAQYALLAKLLTHAAPMAGKLKGALGAGAGKLSGGMNGIFGTRNMNWYKSSLGGAKNDIMNILRGQFGKVRPRAHKSIAGKLGYNTPLLGALGLGGIGLAGANDGD